MATFFGEVLPIYSRAVEDDLDESEVNLEELGKVKTIFPKTQETNPSPRKVDTILLMVGRTASLFAKGNVLGLNTQNPAKSDEHASFCIVKDKILDESDDNFINGLNYHKENNVLVSAFIHPTVENTVVLICENYIKPELTHNTITKIFEHCQITKNTRVIMLTSENWTSFKSPVQQMDYDNFPIIRILPNTHYNHNSSMDSSLNLLEQPNFLAGIVAATLSQCEVKKIPAVALVCYENESTSATLDLFRVTFVNSSKNLKKFVTNSKEIKVKNDLIDHGNLYV